MKKAALIATVLSFVAPAAFGQAEGPAFGPVGPGGLDKTSLIVVSAGDSPEAVSLAKEVRREMERSRRLEPVYVDDDRGARLVAPLTVEKDASGQNLTVAFEVRTARRFTETGQVSCPIAKPANCAREIVVQAETFMRRNRNR